MTNEPLLQLHNVSCIYDYGRQVLDDVNIAVDEGEIIALMGPNGAGKSTVLKTIFGLTTLTDGEVRWEGHSVKPVAHAMVARGICFVPQGRRTFAHLTVAENLEIGAYTVRERAVVRERLAGVIELFPALATKRHAKAGTLSGGQQQMLALARGLMLDPKIMLLDEPSLGLAPNIVREVFAIIKDINERRRTAIVVVEHNLRSLLRIAHRCYVLDKGRVVYSGSARAVAQSKALAATCLTGVFGV